MSMHDEIREYIEGQFRGIPETDQTAEMREEILRNTIDRFDELCAEGMSEYEAYYKAIHSVGDVKEMFSSSGSTADDTPDYSAYADEIREYKRSRAVTLSAAIVLYILCIVPPIIFTGTSMQDTLGPILMFVMIAVATALLIYRAKTADGQLEDIMRYGGVSDESGDYSAEDSRSDRRVQRRADHRRKDNKKRWHSHALRTLKGTIESLNVAAYLVVSFFTGAWHITWLMFVISWAVGNVIKACDDLIACGKDGNL